MPPKRKTSKEKPIKSQGIKRRPKNIEPKPSTSKAVAKQTEVDPKPGTSRSSSNEVDDESNVFNPQSYDDVKVKKFIKFVDFVKLNSNLEELVRSFAENRRVPPACIDRWALKVVYDICTHNHCNLPTFYLCFNSRLQELELTQMIKRNNEPSRKKAHVVDSELIKKYPIRECYIDLREEMVFDVCGCGVTAAMILNEKQVESGQPEMSEERFGDVIFNHVKMVLQKRRNETVQRCKEIEERNHGKFILLEEVDQDFLTLYTNAFELLGAFLIKDERHHNVLWYKSYMSRWFLPESAVKADLERRDEFLELRNHLETKNGWYICDDEEMLNQKRMQHFLNHSNVRRLVDIFFMSKIEEASVSTKAKLRAEKLRVLYNDWLSGTLKGPYKRIVFRQTLTFDLFLRNTNFCSTLRKRKRTVENVHKSNSMEQEARIFYNTRIVNGEIPDWITFNDNTTKEDYFIPKHKVPYKSYEDLMIKPSPKSMQSQKLSFAKNMEKRTKKPRNFIPGQILGGQEFVKGPKQSCKPQISTKIQEWQSKCIPTEVEEIESQSQIIVESQDLSDWPNDDDRQITIKNTQDMLDVFISQDGLENSIQTSQSNEQRVVTFNDVVEILGENEPELPINSPEKDINDHVSKIIADLHIENESNSSVTGGNPDNEEHFNEIYEQLSQTCEKQSKTRANEDSHVIASTSQNVSNLVKFYENRCDPIFAIQGSNELTQPQSDISSISSKTPSQPVLLHRSMEIQFGGSLPELMPNLLQDVSESRQIMSIEQSQVPETIQSTESSTICPNIIPKKEKVHDTQYEDYTDSVQTVPLREEIIELSDDENDAALLLEEDNDDSTVIEPRNDQTCTKSVLSNVSQNESELQATPNIELSSQLQEKTPPSNVVGTSVQLYDSEIPVACHIEAVNENSSSAANSEEVQSVVVSSSSDELSILLEPTVPYESDMEPIPSSSVLITETQKNDEIEPSLGVTIKKEHDTQYENYEDSVQHVTLPDEIIEVSDDEEYALYQKLMSVPSVPPTKNIEPKKRKRHYPETLILAQRDADLQKAATVQKALEIEKPPESHKTLEAPVVVERIEKTSHRAVSSANSNKRVMLQEKPTTSKQPGKNKKSSKNVPKPDSNLFLTLPKGNYHKNWNGQPIYESEFLIEDASQIMSQLDLDPDRTQSPPQTSNSQNQNQLNIITQCISLPDRSKSSETLTPPPNQSQFKRHSSDPLMHEPPLKQIRVESPIKSTTFQPFICITNLFFHEPHENNIQIKVDIKIHDPAAPRFATIEGVENFKKLCNLDDEKFGHLLELFRHHGKKFVYTGKSNSEDIINKALNVYLKTLKFNLIPHQIEYVPTVDNRKSVFDIVQLQSEIKRNETEVDFNMVFVNDEIDVIREFKRNLCTN
uniref:CSON005547 protein n=1 Tax=Culicoides sonorensis TaxID=179676 RepID=A0A336MQS6_CULSO